MATFAALDYTILINSVDMSAHIKEVTVNHDLEVLEDTAFGDTYRSRLGGLKQWDVEIMFNQDFAAAGPDATIFPLFGTVVPFSIKPTSAAASATNPMYTGSVLISEYPPFGNEVGELGSVEVTWPGTGELTRAIL